MTYHAIKLPVRGASQPLCGAFVDVGDYGTRERSKVTCLACLELLQPVPDPELNPHLQA